MNTRSKLLNIAIPVTKWLGQIHMPYTHKDVQGYHVYSIVPYLKAGAGFVTYTKGELSNLFIPGEFSHYAMYYQEDHLQVDGKSYKVPYVVEAIGKGVVKTDLITFLTKKDRVVLFYPTFCDYEVMKRASEIAIALEGLPYDYHFTSGNKAFFCSEVGYYAYEQACKEYGLQSPFTKRTTWGEETVTPQDYINATHGVDSKWEIIWDSQKIYLPMKQ